MKNRAIVSVLAVFFVFTVAIGLLSPQEAEHLLDQSVEILEAADEEVLPTAAVEEDELITEKPTLHSVVRVIDGDTIVINFEGKNETVRLIGIDTPETVHPSEPVGCFGKEASAKTKELLTDRKVRLQFDEREGERDKYYRLLGYVWRDDGLFINQALIAEGYAYEYTYDLPYLYQAEFQAAEREARENNLGLWGATNCVVFSQAA